MGGFVSFAYGAVGRRGRHPIEGAIPLPPPLGEGLTCGRGRGWLAAVGVVVAGRADVRRADVRRWQRRVVAAAGSGGYWRVWPRWAAARRAVAAVGGGSGGQRRVVAGVAAAGVAVAGVAVAGVAAAGLVVCVVARLLGLKVFSYVHSSTYIATAGHRRPSTEFRCEVFDSRSQQPPTDRVESAP